MIEQTNTIGIKADLEEVKKHTLDSLRLLVEICEKNNINYYLVGGSLIGALRHKGFIPWDDDIDVAMPRPDYNRFLEIVGDSLPVGFDIKYMTSDPNYKCYHAKLINNEFRVLWPQGQYVMRTGVWIDIFPLDGLPNGFIKRELHLLGAYARKAIYKFSQIQYVKTNKEGRPFVEKILISIALKLHLNKVIRADGMIEKIDVYLQKYDYHKSKYVWDYDGRYGRKEIIPSHLFEGARKICFEGMDVNAPLKAEELTEHFYGNYMELPQEELRESHELYLDDTQFRDEGGI